MGSTASANHEWIELFNSGESVSVDGWTLTDSTNLSIALVGTIPANTYVLLERNRSDGVSVSPTLSAFLNYAGALVNTGATLILRDGNGQVVDQVAGGENWQQIGGDNVTKDTAQYSTAGWITAPPTPGRANATTPSLPPTAAPASSAASRQSGGSGAAAVVRSNSPASAPAALALTITIPEYIYVGQPVTFAATPTGGGAVTRNSLVYHWNFGDLHTGTSSRPTHTYQFPGTYTAVVQASFAKQTVHARQAVVVLPLTVSLAHSAQGDVLLHNDALYEVDLSLHLLAGSKTRRIPPRTYIAPRETITVPWSMVGNSPFPAVRLYGQAGQVVADTTASVVQQTSSPTPTLASTSVAPVQNQRSAASPLTTAEIVPAAGLVANTGVPVGGFGFANPLVAVPPQSVAADVTESLSEPRPLVGVDGGADTPLPDALPLTAYWPYVVLLLLLGGGVGGLLWRSQTR